MANAIEVLSGLKSGSGRAVAVCGDMLELGSGAEDYHKRIATLAVRSGIDVFIAVGDFAGVVTDAARHEARLLGRSIETRAFKDTASLCEEIKNLVRPGDTILFKASRSIGLEKAAALFTEN
jgi:UDP-N-acetylmuramoyl-tripeptide--D-alanyl-D-alanine ligase